MQEATRKFSTGDHLGFPRKNRGKFEPFPFVLWQSYGAYLEKPHFFIWLEGCPIKVFCGFPIFTELPSHPMCSKYQKKKSSKMLIKHTHVWCVQLAGTYANLLSTIHSSYLELWICKKKSFTYLTIFCIPTWYLDHKKNERKSNLMVYLCEQNQYVQN